MRRSLGSLCALVMLIVCPSRLSAAPIFLDFDGLNDLDIIGTLFPDVAFTNAIVLASGAAGGSLNEFDFPPTSEFNVASDFGGAMRLLFPSTVDSFSGHFTYVAPLVIRAFDASDTELGSVASAFGSNTAGDDPINRPPGELLSLNLLSISYLTITGLTTGSSFIMDDVRFNTTPDSGPQPVPEPSSLVLLGMGVAVVINRRRKRTKS